MFPVLPPNVGGFVGGDHVTALLATQEHWRGAATSLVMDIGTNTEISGAGIKEGDQVKLSSDDGETDLDVSSPYYLVVRKETGGSDIVLDRNVIKSDDTGITGTVGVYRNSLRLFSHRILTSPFKKSSQYEIIVRWRVRFS